MTKEVLKKITEDIFDDTIKQGVVLVDFYADWCGPCRMMTPVLETVAYDLKNVATLVKLDVDHAQRIAASYEITTVPTLVLFLKGVEKGRLIGVCDQQKVKDLILSVSV